MANNKSIDKKKSGELTETDDDSWESLLVKVSGKPIQRRKELISKTANVFLLLDISSSMDRPDKITQAKNGASEFVKDAISRGYNVGLIVFGSRSEMLSDLTNNSETVINSIQKITPYGSTNMSEAILIGVERLLGNDRKKAICLFTDGMPDNKNAAIKAADSAKSKGIDIICKGTYDADLDFLNKLSSRDGLSSVVSNDKIQTGISDMAKLLPPPNEKHEEILKLQNKHYVS